MKVRTACLLVVFMTSPVFAAGRAARPTDDALLKAQAEVTAVFGDRLAAAKKPTEQAALAREMLRVVQETVDDPAGQFAILRTARDLAADAKDWPLTMEAISALVERFRFDGPTNAADQIKRGDELRALAANKKEPVGVSRGLELEAAEWYLRALQTSKGLRRLLAEKRLGDMEEAIVGKRTVRADDVETLMGTWEIEATNGYHGFWTFFADGTVLSLATPNAEKGLGGVWSVEQKDIKIIWDKKGWNTFHRPLSVRETRGDSWLGVGIITAKKLADRQGRFGNDVPDAAEDIRALIGTWKVTAGKWQAFWTFFEDGTVLRSSTLDPLTGPRGVWNIGPTYVKITWNEKAWETFPRPLDVNETHGDSWAGKGYVRAKKLNNRNGRLNGVGIIGAQKFADQGHLASRTLDSAKDVGVLIGKWEVQVKSGDYSNFRIFWTFFEDGTIIRARTQEAQSGPRGVWNVESKCVKITWDKIAWETFYRPLDVNETHGDSWKGMGILKAKKVD